MKKNNLFVFSFLAIFFCLLTSLSIGQSTSWKGTKNNNWNDNRNWTNDRPNYSKTAIIGDANFTGSFQPKLTKTSFCKNLLLGNDATFAILNSGNKKLFVKGDVLIGRKGKLKAHKNIITVHGDWINGGVYEADNNTTIFKGDGNSNIDSTNFYNLIINKNSNDTVFVIGNIDIKKNISILKGNLYGGDNEITVAGHWTEVFGHYISAVSKVIFTANNATSNIAIVTAESFYDLIVDAPGGQLRPSKFKDLTIENNFIINEGLFDHKATSFFTDINKTVTGNGSNNLLQIRTNGSLAVNSEQFTEAYIGFETIILDTGSIVIYQAKDLIQIIDPSLVYWDLGLDNKKSGHHEGHDGDDEEDYDKDNKGKSDDHKKDKDHDLNDNHGHGYEHGNSGSGDAVKVLGGNVLVRNDVNNMDQSNVLLSLSNNNLILLFIGI